MLCAAHKHAHSHAHSAQIFSSTTPLLARQSSLTGQSFKPLLLPPALTRASSVLTRVTGSSSAARFGRRPRAVSVGETLPGEALCERIAFYGA